MAATQGEDGEAGLSLWKYTGAEEELYQGMQATARLAGRVLEPAAVRALCLGRTCVDGPDVRCHFNALVAADAVVPEAAVNEDGCSFSIDVMLEQKTDPEVQALRAYLEDGRCR